MCVASRRMWLCAVDRVWCRCGLLMCARSTVQSLVHAVQALINVNRLGGSASNSSLAEVALAKVESEYTIHLNNPSLAALPFDPEKFEKCVEDAQQWRERVTERYVLHLTRCSVQHAPLTTSLYVRHVLFVDTAQRPPLVPWQAISTSCTRRVHRTTAHRSSPSDPASSPWHLVRLRPPSTVRVAWRMCSACQSVCRPTSAASSVAALRWLKCWRSQTTPPLSCTLFRQRMTTTTPATLTTPTRRREPAPPAVVAVRGRVWHRHPHRTPSPPSRRWKARRSSPSRRRRPSQRAVKRAAPWMVWVAATPPLPAPLRRL